MRYAMRGREAVYSDDEGVMATSASAIILSMFFAVQLSLLPDDEDAEAYIRAWGGCMGFPSLLMTISFFALLLALGVVLIDMNFTHGVVQCAILLLTFSASYMLTRKTAASAHSRLKLKAHVSETRSESAE